MKRIVALTGGIGAGKSVVSHVLTALGYPVYDCDSQAGILMDRDLQMQRRIAAEITADALGANGNLNRKAIAQCVFSDSAKLKRLNEIVHAAVRSHCSEWIAAQEKDTVFVETAILYESGMDAMMSEVWEVTAPEELRISRVERRSGLTREEIKSRMAAQQAGTRLGHRILINDGANPLLPQIFSLL